MVLLVLGYEVHTSPRTRVRCELKQNIQRFSSQQRPLHDKFPQSRETHRHPKHTVNYVHEAKAGEYSLLSINAQFAEEVENIRRNRGKVE